MTRGEKISISKRGKFSGGGFQKGHKPFIGTERTRFKKGQVPWNKGNKFPQFSGKNSPNWKGGTTPLIRIIRASREYKLWRKSVFERDNYTCVWCGARSREGKPVIIHADHIKPFADYPELRFAIDNGRTLCIGCHEKTDTYKRKKYKLTENK